MLIKKSGRANIKPYIIGQIGSIGWNHPHYSGMEGEFSVIVTNLDEEHSVRMEFSRSELESFAVWALERIQGTNTAEYGEYAKPLKKDTLLRIEKLLNGDIK